MSIVYWNRAHTRNSLPGLWRANVSTGRYVGIYLDGIHAHLYRYIKSTIQLTTIGFYFVFEQIKLK